MMDSLQERYNTTVVPKLKDKFQYSNPMQVPAVKKIVLNMGLGGAVQDAKILEHAVDQLTTIAGQKPVVTQAKASIATFKLRKGMKIGASVTLRRRQMYAFLNRLINVALPQVKDFKGLSTKAMDGRGNYSLGVKEQLIFPEIQYDKIDTIRGLSITIVTSAQSDEEGCELLRELGFPFRN